MSFSVVCFFSSRGETVLTPIPSSSASQKGNLETRGRRILVPRDSRSQPPMDVPAVTPTPRGGEAAGAPTGWPDPGPTRARPCWSAGQREMLLRLGKRFGAHEDGLLQDPVYILWAALGSSTAAPYFLIINSAIGRYAQSTGLCVAGHTSETLERDSCACQRDGRAGRRRELQTLRGQSGNARTRGGAAGGALVPQPVCVVAGV